MISLVTNDISLDPPLLSKCVIIEDSILNRIKVNKRFYCKPNQLTVRQLVFLFLD